MGITSNILIVAAKSTIAMREDIVVGMIFNTDLGVDGHSKEGCVIYSCSGGHSINTIVIIIGYLGILSAGGGFVGCVKE